ncbi:PIG-L deacetylase family protein [Sinomonas sp.]|uniref:PIG-L deacetylase family protein n=1 Tax=Sinomonas sp. TaxID=1914986 RepID=UPI003F81D669
MSSHPTSRTLMLVVAHPDDDAFGIAGSVALHGDEPAFRFVLVHATDGAAGQIAPEVNATPATLGVVRRLEAQRAWKAHGRVPDRHVWLGYDDGAMARADFGALVSTIRSLLLDERPDVVFTFGPDGITGHPDHIVVGHATDVAFASVAGDGGCGLRRLLHAAIKQSAWERVNRARVRAGMSPWDPTLVYHFRGIPDELIDIRVDTRAVVEHVVDGIAEHRSQRLSLFEGPVTRQTWLSIASREYFVQAWPPRERGLPLLKDIFEGLE